MEKRSGNDRRRFVRLNDRRKELTASATVTHLVLFIAILGVGAIIAGYWFLAMKF